MVFPYLFLVHFEVFFQQIDNPIIVTSKKSNKIPKKEKKSRRNHAIVQFARCTIEVEKCVDLCLKHWQCFQEGISGHQT